MSRSLKKGPYVDPKLLKKVAALKSGSDTVIKTWSRASEISPEMVGYLFGVHNGKIFVEVRVTEEFRGGGPETLAPYDVVIVNYSDNRKPELRWGDRADNALLNFARGGKGGGGRPDMAQAGGPDTGNAGAALGAIEKRLSELAPA